MPKSKHPEQEDQQEREHHAERESHSEHEHHAERERKKSGDSPRAHNNIIQRRWLGSRAPTPELYARALRQWQALPGAVVSSATDITVSPKKTTGPAGNGDKP